MNTIRMAVEEYLQLRRTLGYKLEGPDALLRAFGRYLEQQRASRVTTALALRWACSPAAADPAWWAKRLGIVRRFATHHSATDPRTEIPPADLLPYRPLRRQPYLYSDAEVERLLCAARALRSRSRLRSRSALRAATYATLIGLLAVTGLRISEAIAIDDPDVDLADGVLTIRRTKFGKSRLVPLHPSTTRVLRRYRQRRDRVHPTRATGSFLVSERGRRLTVWAARWTFIRLSRAAGLRAPTDRRGPRLHDFRHRLAVTTLLRWYRRGVDVEQRLPALSTYLGHGHVADTYWYLTAVPELLRLATERLEARSRVSS
jgi:integrase